MKEQRIDRTLQAARMDNACYNYIYKPLHFYFPTWHPFLSFLFHYGCAGHTQPSVSSSLHLPVMESQTGMATLTLPVPASSTFPYLLQQLGSVLAVISYAWVSLNFLRWMSL